MTEIIVRELENLAEVEAAEDLQRRVWSRDPLELTPAHLLHALQYNGAALLGAFDDGELVGFSLGVIATVEGLTERIDQVAAARLKLYSAMTGVLPAYQRHGVGYKLKLAQRDFALRIGIRLITWTYDPLESVNGRFNIGKLGAVCSRYLRNFHGELGGINAGLATDRFDVDWWITSNRVKSRTAQEKRPLSLESLIAGGALLVNEAYFDRGGLPVPPLNYVSHPANLILVEIPADYQRMKREDMDLARRWRAHTATIFEELFFSGFLVTDFVRHTDVDGREHSYYLLTFRDA